MSSQFQIYLLPSDVYRLLADLQEKVGFKSICAKSPTINPQGIDFLRVNESALGSQKNDLPATFYLTSGDDAILKTCYMPIDSSWKIQVESEAIEFQTCQFDRKTLVRGRLYYQSDYLIGDQITLKSANFTSWAEEVFRIAKRSLTRLKAIDAYVGPDAECWKREGGRFAWMISAARGPIFEEPFENPD